MTLADNRFTLIEAMENESKKGKGLPLLLGLSGVALLGFIDYHLAANVTLELFFLIPVSLVVWSEGKKAGIFISVASAIAGLIAELASNPSHTLSTVPYWNAVSNLGLFMIITWLLPVLKREREKELARLDFLTGVLNKKSFLELVETEIQRAQRYPHPLTVAYLDIDNLRFINERFGHNTGDTLLQSVAHTLKEKIRVVDTIARLGGDEFALLFPETQPEAAQIVTRRIHKSLVDAMQKNEWPVTFSIGLVTYNQPPNSVGELMKKVDVLLFAAKESGKNMIKHEIADSPVPRPSS